MQIKFTKATGSHRIGKVATYPEKIARALIKMKIAEPYTEVATAKGTYNTRMMTAAKPVQAAVEVSVTEPAAEEAAVEPQEIDDEAATEDSKPRRGRPKKSGDNDK